MGKHLSTREPARAGGTPSKATVPSNSLSTRPRARRSSGSSALPCSFFLSGLGNIERQSIKQVASLSDGVPPCSGPPSELASSPLIRRRWCGPTPELGATRLRRETAPAPCPDAGFHGAGRFVAAAAAAAVTNNIAPKMQYSSDLEPLFPIHNGNLISLAHKTSPQVPLTNSNWTCGALSLATPLI